MPLPAYLRSACTALLLGGTLATAQAGLFDDEEARKAIVDLRGRLVAVEEAAKARALELSTLNTQLLEQLTAMRRSMLDLSNQIETLRGQIATLRRTGGLRNAGPEVLSDELAGLGPLEAAVAAAEAFDAVADRVNAG